jgi:hypothetical protein
MPLAAARTYVFQVFFRTYVAIIGFSAFNGLVVLPVILSMVQPTSFNTIRNKLGIAEQGRGEKDGGQSAIDSANADHQSEKQVVPSKTTCESLIDTNWRPITLLYCSPG